MIKIMRITLFYGRTARVPGQFRFTFCRLLLQSMLKIFSRYADQLRSYWLAEKVPCFHCGDSVRKSGAVTAHFDGADRLVCCRGCAAVLTTVEKMGMKQQYYEEKQSASQDEK